MSIGAAIALSLLAISPLAQVRKVPPASSGGTWGGITGTLSAQTDLQAALDAAGGNPFDQDLNTDDDVEFHYVTVNSVFASNFNASLGADFMATAGSPESGIGQGGVGKDAYLNGGAAADDGIGTPYAGGFAWIRGGDGINGGVQGEIYLESTSGVYFNPSGVKATAANGILTILGLGDGADEDLVLDFNTTANTIGVSSTTGATKLALNGMTLNGASGGGLVLVEKKLITSAQTDVTFSGLDGDTDKVYMLVGRIVVPATGSNPTFSWQPNAITTNQSSQRQYSNTTNVAASQSADLWLLDAIVATTVSFEIKIHASKVENSVAMVRNHFGTWQAIYSGSIAAGIVSGQWNETSTNITSLVIHSSIASKIGDGSTFALYKYAQQ